MADDQPDTYSASRVKNRTHTIFKKKIKTSTGRCNLRDKILLNTCQRLQEGDLIKEYEFFMSSSENKGQKQVI